MGLDLRHMGLYCFDIPVSRVEWVIKIKPLIFCYVHKILQGILGQFLF